MEYQHYDGMGVPITWKILQQSRKPSDYDDYPYLYEGTTEEDHTFTLTVEERKCCIYLFWNVNIQRLQTGLPKQRNVNKQI